MNNNIDHEKIFFNYFLLKPRYLKNVRPEFFSNSDLGHISKLAKNFHSEFSEAPSSDQMRALVSDDPSDISDDIVNSIYEINLNEYDKDWLQRTSEAWLQWKHFNKQLVKTVEFTKTQKVSAENVEKIVQQGISMLSTDGSISFNNDIGLDFFDPESHTYTTHKKIETGWTFVDRVSGGGYDTKSLVVYAGEQNVGKCFLYDTLINIRSKKTGKTQKIKIGDFLKLVKKSQSSNV